MGTTPYQVRPLTQVNTFDGGFPQRDAQISTTPNGGYVIVWTDDRTSNWTSGQTYDAAGNQVGGGPLIPPQSPADPEPAVTVLSNGLVVQGYRGGLRWAATETFDSSSLEEVVGQQLLFFPADAQADAVVNPALTSFADGSYVMAAVLVRPGGYDGDVVGRFVNANGQWGPEYSIFDEGLATSDNSEFPDLATLSNGNFVAVWQDEFNGSTTDYDVMFHIMTPPGGSIWGPDTVSGAGSGGAETDPDVAALTGGGFVVVWTDADSSSIATDIRATIYTIAGNVVRSNIPVNTTTTGPQNEPSVVGLLDGGFLVAWDDDQFNYIRGQRFDAGGNPVGSEFIVAQGPYEAPAMARLLDGRIAFAIDDNSSGDFDVATS